MTSLDQINLNDGSINWGPTREIAEYHQQKFKEFLSRGLEGIKRACFGRGKRLKHILNAEHYDLPTLEHLCEVTNAIRRTNKLPNAPLKSLLRDKSVLNYFAQPSSRTFNSFSAAESLLGMRREELRDLSTSSAVKGETDRDALRTHSSYYQALVFRNKCDYFDLFALWVMKTSQRPVPLINGGAGKQEHPTQALLDYYTIRESHDHEIDGKSFAFVGDCKRGRTVHSLAKVLALHQNITFYFVAPVKYQIDWDTYDYVKDRGCKTHLVTNGLAEIVSEITGAIYMTRIQDEHDQDGTQKGYDPRFIFREKMLRSMGKNTILMHPLPKREEIDPALDYSNDHRIMIWRQMRNGMWARAALFAYLFNIDQKVLGMYHDCERATAPKPL